MKKAILLIILTCTACTTPVANLCRTPDMVIRFHAYHECVDAMTAAREGRSPPHEHVHYCLFYDEKGKPLDPHCVDGSAPSEKQVQVARDAALVKAFNAGEWR